jgi:hypothetical protein
MNLPLYNSNIENMNSPLYNSKIENMNLPLYNSKFDNMNSPLYNSKIEKEWSYISTSSLHMPVWHAHRQLYLHRGTFLAAKLEEPPGLPWHKVKRDIKVGLE